MTQPSYAEIPLGQIQVSPTNPRKKFDEDALNELAKSIEQQGLAQPILVRPHNIQVVGRPTYYEIVAGERRFRASKIAGKEIIPALIRTLTDAQALEIQVIENLQRADLHPLEEAEGYEQLMKLHNTTADDLVAKVGKSRSYIYGRIKLLALFPGPRKAFYEGKLTPVTALLVARIPIQSLQLAATEEISSGYNGPMSARAARDHIERRYMLQLGKALFSTTDPDLVKGASACSTCPNRTGNQPEIFTDIESVDTCTNPDCFEKKKIAHFDQVKKEAVCRGQKIISGDEAKKIRTHPYNNHIEGGYTKLDETFYDGKKSTTYRQTLKNTDIDIVLLEDPYTKDVIEIVKTSQMNSILEKKGMTDPKAAGKSEEEKTREREIKIRRAFKRRLFDEVKHKPTDGIPPALRRKIAELLFTYTDGKAIADLYGWGGDPDHYHFRSEVLPAILDKTPDEILPKLIRDIILARDISTNSYNYKDDPKALLAAAIQHGIDHESILTEITDEITEKSTLKRKKAEKTEPQKPAKKTTPKSKKKEAKPRKTDK